MYYYLVGTKRKAQAKQNYFTYHNDKKLKIGQIVLVKLGKISTVGIIFKEVKKPINFQTKPIEKILYEVPLAEAYLKSLQWLSDYYISDISEVIQTALPSGIEKNRRELKNKNFQKENNLLTPNEDQLNAINHVFNSDNQTFLLHGITGSGKTTVYLELAKKILNQNKSVIFIVPEISLTTQLLQQVNNYFKDVILMHSQLSESKKHQNWVKSLISDNPVVIVGTRSALFTPVKNLGLIIIDECHEQSLKQDKNPKYNALRLASVLAKNYNAKAVFGSATPLVSDYWLAEQKNSSIIKLNTPAISVNKPEIKLIDMTKKDNFKNHRFLSNELIKSIKKSLKNHEQSLIFHNRRGSTKITTCKSCGWIAECEDCHIPLSMHNDKFKLICHNCGKHFPIPKKCPICGSAEIIHKGVGTKLIESELRKIFPNSNIKRFDNDTQKSETLNELYDDVKGGKVDILIGTQILAKGLNLPKLSTVGIIQADTGLSIPDFTNEERIFQLITQVIGRVGRNMNKTQVILQTFQPNNKIINFAMNQNYSDFYSYEINKRKKLKFPPYYFLLKLKISYKTEQIVIKHAKNMAQYIKNNFKNVEIIGPMPSFYENINNKVNWQIIIKSKKRQTLVEIVKDIDNPNWQYDIDPSSLL